MNENNDAVAAPPEPPVRPRTPKGVVALLVAPDGRELANAADFGAGAPAGFSRRDYQESAARRALALAAMRGLASPIMSDAIEAYTAENIMRAMCNQGCRVLVVPVGYEE